MAKFNGDKKFSSKTIDRALLYIRTLERMLKAKRNMVSSKQLAEITGLSDVQIRKDISSFGKVGTPRLGYKVSELKAVLEDFVLQKNVVHIVLFGVGNLGSAMMNFPGFHTDRLKLVAAFDKSDLKISRKINGVTIYPVDLAPEMIRKEHAEIGIIAVPREEAQEIADIMVMSGIEAIVNFAPTSVTVPKSVQVKDIDFTIEFLSLFAGVLRCRGCDLKEQK